MSNINDKQKSSYESKSKLNILCLLEFLYKSTLFKIFKNKILKY